MFVKKYKKLYNQTKRDDKRVIKVEQTQDISKSYIRGGIRDKKSPIHWRTLSDNFSLLGKPKKIIVLPGNAAITPKQANGMCKSIENMLETGNQSYEICGFYYSDKEKTPDSVVSRASMLLDYFVPLVAQKDQYGDLKRISMDKAAENMRNVIIATHCYGSRIINEVDKKLDEIMKDIGYNDKEIEYIHKQLFVLHQNTPVEDIGINKPKSTNILRISKSDENNIPANYQLKSFPYYILSEQMTEDEVLISPLSDNIHAIITSRVSQKGESEHNGAYWLEDKFKTKAGKKEEIVANAIFNEVVSSDYPIDNLDQILHMVTKKKPLLANEIQEMYEYGREFSEEYFDFVRDVAMEYKQAKAKLLTNNLRSEDIQDLSVEAMFTTDEKGTSLLGYALKQNNYEAISILWQSMKRELPPPNPNEDIKTTYKDEPADMLEALLLHRRYVQQAINDDNIELFKSLSPDADVLAYVDYKQAKGDTLRYAQEIYSPQNTINAIISKKQKARL